MKIVITGASGFVGRELVPLLRERGAEVILVGRSVDRLSSLFPGVACCQYEDIAVRAAGYDVLLHLAVKNNDAGGSLAEFRTVNVDLALRTAEQARAAGIRRFINLSSTHALDPGKTDHYSTTKRAAADALRGLSGIDVSSLYVPLIYSSIWKGKLGFLNKLPVRLRRPAFLMLASIKPTLNVARLADVLMSSNDDSFASEAIITDGQSDNPVYKTVSRGIDLSFAIVVLGLFWYGLILIWIIVRLESRGPGIFVQERVGRHGNVFLCYKFRTMKRDTIQAGTHQVSRNSVTRVGRFLRKSKLDELPQIWNIFRDEIGLIGPRPCLTTQVELVSERTKRGLLALKPGISGLSQVNRVDMSEPKRLSKWDERYLNLQSLHLDATILIATAIGGGRGDNIIEGDRSPA